MLKKSVLILLLAILGSSKLFAQTYNPAITFPDFPCSYTVCLTALDQCRQIACGAPRCVTVPAHSPGIYHANPISGCLNSAGRGCIAWEISFDVGPCEGVQTDAPTRFIVYQGIPMGWTIFGTGQNHSFMWDGTNFFVQP